MKRGKYAAFVVAVAMAFSACEYGDQTAGVAADEVVSAGGTSAGARLIARSLARAPGDMGSWRTDPADGAVVSGFSVRELEFVADATSGESKASMTVHVSGGAPLSLLAPAGHDWRLVSADGQSRDLRTVASIETLTDAGATAEVFTFVGVAAGEYVVEITQIASTGASGTGATGAGATGTGATGTGATGTGATIEVVVSGEAGPAATAYLESYERRVGRRVQLRIGLDDSAAGVIEKAMGTLTRPDGSEESFVARRALDGGWFVPVRFSMAGDYAAHIDVLARDSSGRLFQRTVLVPFSGITPAAKLLAGASSQVLDDDTLRIHLPVQQLVNSDDRHFVHAEVWGLDSAGGEIPVAWVGRMVQLSDGLGAAVDLHAGWLSMAGAPARLILKNVTLASSSGLQTDHAALERIVLPPASLPVNSYAPAPPVPTPGMFGEGPGVYQNPNPEPIAHRVLLMHGMCGTPGNFPTHHFDPLNPGEQSDVIQFDYHEVDANAPEEFSVENDELAARMVAFADVKGINSMSVISNSQGGLATAHLKTFYSSPLDQGAIWPGRAMQTVSTPWHGSQLVNAVKALEVGTGLGSHTARWMLVIARATLGCDARPPKDLLTQVANQNIGLYIQGAANEMHTMSTSHPVGEKCKVTSTLFLPGEDDGAVTRSSAQLPGSTNLGHRYGECHTTDMEYPSNTKNATRNALWGCAAARPGGEPSWCSAAPKYCAVTGCGTKAGFPCAEVGSNTPASFDPFLPGNHPDGDAAADLYCLDVNNDEGDAEMVCVNTLVALNTYEPRCQPCEPGSMRPGCVCDPSDSGSCGNGLSCETQTGYDPDSGNAFTLGHCYKANDQPDWLCSGSCADVYGDYGYCEHDDNNPQCINWNP